MKIITTLATATLPLAATAQDGAASGATFSSITSMIVILFFFLLMVVALLLICREAVCWYFKINSVLKKQDEILRLLKDRDKQK